MHRPPRGPESCQLSEGCGNSKDISANGSVAFDPKPKLVGPKWFASRRSTLPRGNIGAQRRAVGEARHLP
jgi:hypothetical protein